MPGALDYVILSLHMRPIKLLTIVLVHPNLLEFPMLAKFPQALPFPNLVIPCGRLLWKRTNLSVRKLRTEVLLSVVLSHPFAVKQSRRSAWPNGYELTRGLTLKLDVVLLRKVLSPLYNVCVLPKVL